MVEVGNLKTTVKPAGKPPIISVTDSAANRIKFLLTKFVDKGVIGFRVGVKTGGCSGLAYTFNEAYDIKPMEEVVIVNDIKILIEPQAVMYLIGTTMDYVDQKFKSEFVFINPNAKAKCGCGESFSV